MLKHLINSSAAAAAATTTLEDIWSESIEPNSTPIIACVLGFGLSMLCTIGTVVWLNGKHEVQTQSRMEIISIELDEERRRVDRLTRDVKKLQDALVSLSPRKQLPPMPPMPTTARRRRLSQSSSTGQSDRLSTASDTRAASVIEENLESFLKQLENDELQEMNLTETAKFLGVPSLEDLSQQVLQDVCEAVAISQSVHTLDATRQSKKVCNVMLSSLDRLGSSVEHLDLGDCNLNGQDDTIVKSLSCFIRSSCSLRTLNLYGSGLSSEGIIDALRDNTTMTTIAIDGDGETMATIEQIMMRNTALSQ